MSTQIQAFERMATRGSPRGADVLIRDVRESISGHPVATVKPGRSRRPTGPAWAVIAAVLVLTVGLAGGWIAGSADEVSPTGVIWHRVDEPQLVAAATAGPGGFVSAARPAELGAWFSSDGVSWAQSPLPASDGAFIEAILSIGQRWLVVGGNGETRLAWLSDDGRVWSQVDWPDEIEGTIQAVTSNGEHLFALSRDVFDEGTTLWQSADGTAWTEIPTGPITATSGFFEDVSGGLVFRDEATVSVSIDGTSWTTATLTSPSELGEGSVRVVALERLGNRWLAFTEVERVDQDPVLAVLSSADGASWEFEGIPPFGQLDGLAAGVQEIATVGDRLVAVPVETPTSTQEDGTVTANGFVRNTGEIWSSTDGSTWTLELSEDQVILGLDGSSVEGRTIGIWFGLNGQTSTSVQPAVATTAAEMPDEPLDPDGLQFQADVTADGDVTFEEFEQAAEQWKTCMEEHGVTDVQYTIDRSGGLEMSFASPSPNGDRENVISNLCYASWLDRVIATLAGD